MHCLNICYTTCIKMKLKSIPTAYDTLDPITSHVLALKRFSPALPANPHDFPPIMRCRPFTFDLSPHKKIHHFHECREAWAPNGLPQTQFSIFFRTLLPLFFSQQIAELPKLFQGTVEICVNVLITINAST